MDPIQALVEKIAFAPRRRPKKANARDAGPGSWKTTGIGRVHVLGDRPGSRYGGVAKPRVGDELQLPSGRRVRVTAKRVRSRPWAAVFLDRSWHVVRECPPGADRLGVEHYFGGDPASLKLDWADAVALADALNRVR
jgi:hypothetical protein